MSDILIKKAKAIVTCDSQDQVLYDSDILIHNNEIMAIGKDLSEPEGADIINGENKYVYPGLINTHHHFFQAFVRNLLTVDRPNLTVVGWLTEIYKTFRFIDSDVIYYASLACMADLIKHGCTTVFDHQYCYTDATGTTPIDRQMEAAALMGIRFHAGRGVNTRPGSEPGSTMPNNDMCETTDTYIKDCERIIAEYHDAERFAMRRVVLAPCQPINCYVETFTETIKLAREKGVYMHTHMCEGENNVMQEIYGKRSIAWAEEIGFLGPDIWIAHGRETQPFEYPILAKAGTGVCHCPAATMLGATEPLDMPAMLRSGILLSLGCDGCSTNESSNLLDTIRLAYLMQTFRDKEHTGSPLPYEFIKMATVNGAKTLGRNDIGSLSAGMAADLFMIDVDRLEYAGALHDPKSMIPKLSITGPVWLTMVNGRILWRDNQLVNVDEYKLLEEGERTCTRVLRSKCDVFRGLHY